MEEVNYSSSEILRDDNLIFDLKTDIAFKNLFLKLENYTIKILVLHNKSPTRNISLLIFLSCFLNGFLIFF